MENIGSKHIKGCVITWRDKTVKLVATVQFDYQIPEHYDSDDIHWKFNEGTWCASNLADTFTEQDCGCSRTEVKEL